MYFIQKQINVLLIYMYWRIKHETCKKLTLVAGVSETSVHGAKTNLVVWKKL